MGEKNYINLHLLEEIDKKIKTLNKTRDNRINLSERLKKYEERWKIIFFFLNFEAVFLIIKGLRIIDSSNDFIIISAFFSIYVILLQYFISVQNFRERSFKAHYHQLELEDLILKLKRLLIKRNDFPRTDNTDGQSLAAYKEILNDYQMMLKNNENHSSVDNRTRMENEDTGKLSKDNSIDNIFLILNILISIGMLLYIISPYLSNALKTVYS